MALRFVRLALARQALHRGPLVRRAEGAVDLLQHRLVEHAGATQIAAALLRQAGREVAGASLAVLRLAARRQTETLLGTLVGLHLGHWSHPNSLQSRYAVKAAPPASISRAAEAHRDSAEKSEASYPIFFGWRVEGGTVPAGRIARFPKFASRQGVVVNRRQIGTCVSLCRPVSTPPLRWF